MSAFSVVSSVSPQRVVFGTQANQQEFPHDPTLAVGDLVFSKYKDGMDIFRVNAVEPRDHHPKESRNWNEKPLLSVERVFDNFQAPVKRKQVQQLDSSYLRRVTRQEIDAIIARWQQIRERLP